MGETMVTAALIMTGLALIFGTVLAIAFRFLSVETDPMLEELESLLPGTNCGACGTPGCRAFARSLLDGNAVPAACTVSTPEGVGRIAEFLGVAAGSVTRLVARLNCGGSRGFSPDLATYRGVRSCRAAVLVNSGNRACPWGCLGLGDCDIVCDFDAIHMAENGLPVVDEDRCTACGDCVDVCPLDLFTLEPVTERVHVRCNNPLSGPLAREVCSVACDACGRCANLSGGALVMTDGLPRRAGNGPVPAEAVGACPTGAIQALDGGRGEPNRDRSTQSIS